MSEKAIGIFDSGIGGLTVLKALEKELPEESLIYLGDTARVPYGNKSAETIQRYSIENTNFLLETGVKLIVVACNTASALGLETLQKKFSIPIVGVIEPGAEAALRATRSKEIGIIGTEATLASGAYTKKIQDRDPSIRVWGVACPLFVPLVEEGWLEEEATEQIARKYLSSLLRAPIDTLILGCTHYPLLKGLIARILGERVTLVDSAEETAKKVRGLLEEKGLRKTGSLPSTTLFVTDSPHRFKEVGKNFLRRPLDGVTLINLSTASSLHSPK